MLSEGKAYRYVPTKNKKRAQIIKNRQNVEPSKTKAIKNIKVKIINMSSISLSSPQIRILSKGLKFTPTPVSNLTELEKDIDEFCRKLRLKEYFYEDETVRETNDDISLARNKSNFHPKRNRDKTLDTCIDSLQKASKNLKSFSVPTAKENLTHSERRALKQLKQNRNIIIKEADKGGTVCVMDRTFYAEKIHQMLDDSSTYTRIKDDQISPTINKIKHLIKRYPNVLTEKEVDYLTNFEIKGSNLYGLPKVHKSSLINEFLKTSNSEYVEIKSPEDLKFRPIVAGPVCPTSRLSHIIDLIIKPLQEVTQSYVRDDIDLLSKIPRQLSGTHGHTLVTFDVESLYTNIEKGLGIKAIKYWINKHRNLVEQRFSDSFICDAIELILDNNAFQFNDQYYLQTKGTAMGTKFAPAYANLVLAYLEEQMYEELANQKDIAYANYIKNNYLRYLDDVFIIWDNKYSINKFDEQLNNMHPQLTFKMESDKSTIAFLDIKLSLKDGKISTDVFYKPTDSHQFLQFKSCHPRHIKINIPYSQAIRLCTIVDDPDIKEARLHDMKQYFLSCGYPIRLVENAITKAKAIPQADLRTPKSKPSEDVTAFVSTHNPSNPNLWPLIQSTLEVVKTSDRMKEALKQTKIIKSKRQPANLKRILTRANFSNRNNKGGSYKCYDKRCGTCSNINETDSIRITTTGEVFHIRKPMNCKSKNVLYLITCNKCKAQYTGKTHSTLAKRFTVHRQQIRHKEYRQLGLSRHLEECNKKCDIKDMFTVTPFFKLSDNESESTVKEQMFIARFKTELNSLSLN